MTTHRKQYITLLLLLLAALCFFSQTVSLATTKEPSLPQFSAKDYVTLGELRQQTQAGWHQAYTAMGREIKVDVSSPWMPQVDECPIVQVEAWGKGDVTEDMLKVFEAPTLVHANVSPLGISIWLFDDNLWNGSGYRGRVEIPQDANYYLGEIPIEQPEGVELSYQEFLDRIEHNLALVSDFTLADFSIRKVNVRGPEYKAKEMDGTVVLGEPLMSKGGYFLSAYQEFYGIPVLQLNSDMQDAPGGELSYGYYTPESYSFGLSASKEVSTQVPDVPLLSFDAFKQVLEAQIESGNLRGVEELEFGYLTCYQGKKGNRTWLLLPVWRIKGGYTKDRNQPQEKVMPYHDPRDTDGSITVPMSYGDCYYSAQTGEMLPTFMLKRDKTGPIAAGDIITWETIGGKKQ